MRFEQWVYALPLRLRSLFHRRRVEQELDDEIRDHIERQTAAHVAAGMSPSAARAAALRAFGGIEQRKDEVRDTRGVTLIENALQDLRFAARGLRKNPGFTAVAVLTLALGIGANTAIFSVMHHLLLAPLPYPDGNRIVTLVEAIGDGNIFFPVDSALVRAWGARVHSLESLGAAREGSYHLDEETAQDSVAGAAMSPAFLQALDVQPALGRGFTPEEAQAGGPNVAIISYGLWQQRYGARRDVLGSLVHINGLPYTIVGVAPPDMIIPIYATRAPVVWLPLSPDSMGGQLYAFARLRPGGSPAMVSNELQAIVASLPDTGRYNRLHVRAVRAQDFLNARETQTIKILFVAVGVLLLIACANVANLLLARAYTRQREFAIRVALGAGRLRVARQALTESVVLALMGGGLGLLVAWQGLRVIIAMRPPTLDNLAGVHIEPAVLLWSVGISVVTGLLFGAAPALFSTALPVGDTLRAGTWGASGSVAARRIRTGFVIVEVALSLVLLAGAGLLVRSFVTLQRTPLGFDPHGLVEVNAMFPREMDSEHRAALQQMVVQRAQALPGVTQAGVGLLPGEGLRVAADVEVEEKGAPRSSNVHVYSLAFVAPNYFRLVRLAVLAGRAFDSSDVSQGSDEIIINRAFARRLWPDGNAVGSRMRAGPARPWLTVIGVVDDTPMPGQSGDVYDLHSYMPIGTQRVLSAFLVRTTSSATALAPELRRLVATVAPTLVVSRVFVGDMYLRQILSPSRFVLALIGAFALVALLLSAVGLYGVIVYAVTQRTREIGMRVALGARPSAVTRLVLAEGLRLVAGGVFIGLVAAAAAARALRGMLYGVSPADPLTFSAIALLLVAIALLASYVPARRALRIDPAEALRAE